MRALLNACIGLLVLNIATLFFIYGTGNTGDGRDTAQSLGRLISAYSEPNSNPQFLVNAENQCRFWGPEYCARALAKRKSILVAYPGSTPMPEDLRSTSLYAAYVETRKALTQETTTYIAFLNQTPSNAEFVAKSKEFEEAAGFLVGQVISYLYDMQGQAIRKQTTTTERVLMVQYLGLVALLFLVCLLRFRRGRNYG